MFLNSHSTLNNKKILKRSVICIALIIFLIMSFLSLWTLKQLEKDSLLRIRESSDNLVLQVNKKFLNYLKKAEARSVFDYAAKNLALSDKLFYQRSELAKDFPQDLGFKGYFQVDEGVFTTPHYLEDVKIFYRMKMNKCSKSLNLFSY